MHTMLPSKKIVVSVVAVLCRNVLVLEPSCGVPRAASRSWRALGCLKIAETSSRTITEWGFSAIRSKRPTGVRWPLE